MKQQNLGYKMDLPPWIPRWIIKWNTKEKREAHVFSKPKTLLPFVPLLPGNNLFLSAVCQPETAYFSSNHSSNPSFANQAAQT